MSANSYLPLDSDAPPVFKTILMSNYARVAFIILMLYDHIITLDKEVELIWTLRWRLPKIMFLINRYVLTLFIVLWHIPATHYPLSLSFCKFSNNFLTWSPIFTFNAAELVMVIRVCSLYGHRKVVVWLLSGFFVLSLIGSITMQALLIQTYDTTWYYVSLPGCFLNAVGDPTLQRGSWPPSLVLEGTLTLLTAYKVISYRNEMNRTITMLARDSLVYFVIVFTGFALALANSIHTFGAVVFPVIPITQCVVSMAAGRMMMNLRGLILDDPKYTVHLHTLRFASYHDSDEEPA